MAEPANSGKPQAAAVQKTEKAKSTDMFDCEYMRVVFQPKANPNDPNDVVLSVQGFAVKCQRGVETIVPDFILEAADHATYKKFSVEPGQGRKVAATIRKFPYQIVGKATREEFQALYLAGTKKTRQAVAQYGLKIPTEQAVEQSEE